MSYVTYLDELNPKNFTIGQIVFYIDPTSKTWWRGRVKDYYSDGYGLEQFEFVDDRLIDGVPIAEYEFGVEKKLPKSWKYDTELFTIDNWLFGRCYDFSSDFSIETIEEYIKSGLLVKPSTQHTDWKIGAEIDGKTYKVIHELVSPNMSHTHGAIAPYFQHSDYACVNTHFVFATLEEALKPIKEREAEVKRRRELSDYDESVEEMEKVLARWKKLYNTPDADIESTRKFLMEKLDATDDDVIDVRLYQGKIQWADSKSRWKEI